MRLFRISFVPLISSASGQATTSYKTITACTTEYGLSSAPPKSTGYTVTIPLTFYCRTTETATTTITPPVSSVTTTSTITITQTLSKSGSTKTVTPITTTTKTIQTTVYPSTTTTSTTITPATYTVPTRPGFTPIASASGYVPKKRSLADNSPRGFGKFNQAVQRRAQEAELVGSHNRSPTCSRAYPTSTICATVVEAFITSTKTYTAPTKITTTIPASTSSFTSTKTQTTTICATPIRTTQTVTAPTSTKTSTVTKTITSTATSTVTIEAPIPTVYAQCQPDNIINQANGNRGIDGYGQRVEVGGRYDQLVTDSPVSCCEVCARTDYCSSWARETSGGGCSVAYRPPTDGICDSAYDAGYYETGGFAIEDSPFLGQGQCGTLINRGDNGRDPTST